VANHGNIFFNKWDHSVDFNLLILIIMIIMRERMHLKIAIKSKIQAIV
jgi:hypothetical protein